MGGAQRARARRRPPDNALSTDPRLSSMRPKPTGSAQSRRKRRAQQTPSEHERPPSHKFRDKSTLNAQRHMRARQDPPIVLLEPTSLPDRSVPPHNGDAASLGSASLRSSKFRPKLRRHEDHPRFAGNRAWRKRTRGARLASHANKIGRRDPPTTLPSSVEEAGKSDTAVAYR